jgi:hypothetical protein
MRCTATATEELADRSPRFDPSRFDARDRRAASREEALRLAREARTLPEAERWAYLRTVRAIARREGLAGMEKLELLHPAPAADLDLQDPAPVRDMDLHRAAAQEVRRGRRGLRAFALTGAVVGMAVALLLPPSLSERLPGTSGNDRAPLAAQPPASTGAKAPRRRAAAPPTRPVDHRDARRSGGLVHARLSNGRLVAGRGDAPIGTLRVDRPMRLVWASDGRRFSITSSEWQLRPRSDRGTTILSPGTYRRLAVKSSARWTIRLVPAAAR